MIDFLDIVILRDITEDKDDYYYKYEKLDGSTYESSAIVGFTPLKGRLSKEEYKKHEDWWNMNTKGNLINDNFTININNGIIEIDGIINNINSQIIYRRLKNLLVNNTKAIYIGQDENSKKELNEILEFINDDKEINI